MAYATTEERVDRLEALFGQFLTEMVVLSRAAEERNRLADERMSRFENEMRDFKNEMRDFKNEMLEFKNEMLEFKNEMLEFKNEMVEFKNEMVEFKNEMRTSKRELDKKWGELSDSMGTLIEDLVAPCGFQLARAIFRTEEAEACAIRIKRRHPLRPGELIELDLLAVGPTQALVVEAKRRVNAEKATQLRGKASSLAEFFPDYANRRVHCAVASPYLDPSVLTFLTRERIYGIAMGEETMEVVNLNQF